MPRSRRGHYDLGLETAGDEHFDPQGFLDDPVTIPPPAPVAPPPSFVSETGADADDDLSFLQGEGWVRISRVSDQGETLFLRKMERKVLGEDIAFIARTWGGGRYWLEVQNGNRQWVKKRYVNFDPKEYGAARGAATLMKTNPTTGSPIIVEQAERTTDPLIAAQISALSAAQEKKDAEIKSLNQQILTMQAENNRAIMELVTKAMTAPKAVDPFADLSRLAALRDLFSGGVPKGDALTDLAKTFMPPLLEAFKEFAVNRPAAPAAGVPDNSSPLERLAMPFIQAFVPLVARGIAQQGAAPKPPLRRPAAGAPVSPAPATVHTPVHPGTNGASEGGENLMEKIKAHPAVKLVAPVLLSMVKNGTPVEEAAQTVADLVPDAYWDVVVQLVNREDMIPYLAMFEPEIVNHAAWMTALADTIKRDHIVDDEEDEDDGDEDDLTAAAPAAGAGGGATPPSGGVGE